MGILVHGFYKDLPPCKAGEGRLIVNGRNDNVMKSSVRIGVCKVCSKEFEHKPKAGKVLDHCLHLSIYAFKSSGS